MRAAIAAAMSRSKREIPHYYLSETIPMAHALDWLAQRNAGLPITERILPAVLLLKAVALALRRTPELNGFFRDGEFRPATAVHVGVAISLRAGAGWWRRRCTTSARRAAGGADARPRATW